MDPFNILFEEIEKGDVTNASIPFCHALLVNNTMLYMQMYPMCLEGMSVLVGLSYLSPGANRQDPRYIGSENDFKDYVDHLFTFFFLCESHIKSGKSNIHGGFIFAMFAIF